MTDHNQRKLSAFEAALRVRVPRERSDVPARWVPLFMLFCGTVESLLSIQTPLSGILEGGLIVRQLEEAGADGQRIETCLAQSAASARALKEAQLEILERLLRIFLGGEQPSTTMEAVKATGIYPGDTPKDFDPFDHM